jgi:hypothetical protein
MNKTARMILVIVFVFGFVLMSSPLQAQAKKIDPPLNIAAGSWTDGSSIEVASLTVSAPNWLQLLSNDGVKMESTGKICHPLHGGQYGWIGEIRQYKNGQWFKLETTNGWVPNEEGEYMACAQAPTAGTYALFGYWIRPAGYVDPSQSSNGFDCSALTWTASVNITKFTGSVSSVPANTQVIVSIAKTSIPVTITGFNSTTTDAAGNFVIDSEFSTKPATISFLFTLPEYGCTYTTEDIVYK